MSLPEGWESTGWQTESGQAWVYQVRRRGDASRSLFALKRLKNPRRRARFAREVEAMDRLRRDHAVAVPAVIDRDLDAQRPWFAMRWYGGGSLEDAVHDGRFKSNLLAGLAVLIELAATVADVHAAGVAHRDLKPSNVLFGESGLVLADFGLCLELDEEGARLTDTYEAVGSRLYIAPENEAGINPEIGQRPADAYAFGKSLWAVLAGRQPLPRELVLEQQHHLSELFDDSRLAPVDGLLRGLLNRDPRARLIDWTLVVEDLHAVERALRGIDELSVAPASRSVAIARRLAYLPQVEAAIHDADNRRRQEAWWRELIDAMKRKGRIVRPALQPLTREVRDLLEFTATSGGIPSGDQLAESGLESVAAMTIEPPPGVGDSDEATCFVVYSPRAIPGFPTVGVRVWPSLDAGQIWINRVPMVCPVGGRETVPAFLASFIAERFGPFPALRQRTIDEALAIVEQTAALFVSLVEHYLEIVDRGDDPTDPPAWAGRDVVPAPLVAVEPDRPGDTEAPILRSFDIAPTTVELHDTPVSVSCRARITDDGAGVAGEGYSSSPSQARFRSPSGQVRDVIFDHSRRISGDALDGTYQDRLILSPEVERGDWIVEHVLVVDQVGNVRRYSTDDLHGSGMPTRLDVL